MEKVAKQSTQSGRKNHYFLILPVMSLWKPNKTGYERRRELQKSLNPARFHLHPQGKKKTIWNNPECIWALFDDDLPNTVWGMGGQLLISIPVFFFLYLQITKGLFPVPCMLPRRDYQREGTGFQVRTLRLCYRLFPGEAALGTSAGGKLPLCATLVRGREASRLAWRSGIPILLTFAGISVGSDWAPRILLWLIAATLKAKSGQRRRGRRVSGLLNSYYYQHNVWDMPFIPSEDTSWA